VTAEIIRLDDPEVLVRFTRSARARRFTLSVRDGEARLTAPRGAPQREAARFLDHQREWLRGAITRAPAPLVVAPGVTIPLDGGAVRIGDSGRRRGPCALRDGVLLAPGATAGPAVAAWLKARALSDLAPAARQAAQALEARIGRIALRDTRSRWGSCTSRGDLSFSWRLAMAPPAVRRYVAIHEAAHLREMNHGPGFWALVAALDPAYRTHRNWLRREGPRLHGFDFRGARTP
jgi:predicted metal-dependent hydrolase